MYRNYIELNENEKQELRDTLYCASLYDRENPYYASLEAHDQEAIDNCLFADEIPEIVMCAAFDGISFVEEDFFCNL